MTSGQYFTYRYRIEQKLGSGGMGVVFEATDLLKQKQIALKQLRTDVDSASTGYTSSDDLKRAMAEEFRILASLRHPNIISVLDYGLDITGQPFYTMELLSEVEELLADGSRTPVETVHLLIELLQALMYLHRYGIVHRDLKPGNVVLDAQRKVRVLDFGLSQQQGSLIALAGTLAYIAPELLMEQPVSVQSDLYAVGVIAYQLFEKQHPFGETDNTQFLQRLLYQSPTSFTQQTPPDIQYVI